jgi:hypothetical protein
MLANGKSKSMRQNEYLESIKTFIYQSKSDSIYLDIGTPND